MIHYIFFCVLFFLVNHNRHYKNILRNSSKLFCFFFVSFKFDYADEKKKFKIKKKVLEKKKFSMKN